MRTAASQTCSVVICCYTEERWASLERAVASARAQRARALEVIVVVDHNEELLLRCQEQFAGVRVVASTGRPGLSGARNTGVALARGEIVAFLDDDAEAAEDWIAELLSPYAGPEVVGVGGEVIPVWPDRRPDWFPIEFDWVVGCTYGALPQDVHEVRNPIGANMGFRREVLLKLGGFREDLGRSATGASGCEETELSIRIRQDNPQARIVMAPQAKVRHQVSPARASGRYFLRRCYAEGRSKALVSSGVGRGDALATERRYVIDVLLSALRRCRPRTTRNATLSSLSQAAFIVMGLAVTALGYGAEASLLELRRRSSRN